MPAHVRHDIDQPLAVLLDALASSDNPAPAIVEGYLAPFNAVACMIHARREGMLAITAHAGFPDDAVMRYALFPEQARLPMSSVIRMGMDEWVTSEDLARPYPLATALAQSFAAESTLSFHALRRAGVPVGSISIAYDANPERSWDLSRRIEALTRAISLWLDRPIDAQPAPASGSPEVTERQREVLAQLCDDRTNQQIADSLGVSVATIKADLASLFSLLGTRRRSELPARAIRAGI